MRLHAAIEVLSYKAKRTALTIWMKRSVSTTLQLAVTLWGAG